MSRQIFFYAALIGSLASGCTGNSEGQSESGQGGTIASGSKTVGPAVIGGNHSSAATLGSTWSGGQPGDGTGAGGSSSGGNIATTLTIAGAGDGGRGSGGRTANGGSTSVGGQSTGASKGSGTVTTSPKGGANQGGNGGLAGGGKSAGGGSFAGSASGGKSTGGSAGSAGKDTGGGLAGKSGQVVLPETNASFDYQIGGAYTPPSGVSVVSRDRNSAPAQGIYNICYVNGFQIQPDEENYWASQHPSLILKDASGNPVVDEDWRETLLDTSTAAKRTELSAVIGEWIAKCKSDGFNAVEIDNLDSYSRSNGLLTQANNIALMALLSSAAHASGLAIAQKNSGELLGSVSAMKTDFAIVEECNRYNECEQFQSAYGNLVFIIEYRQQDYQKGCTAYPELSIVLRDLNVSASGKSGYVYEGC